MVLFSLSRSLFSLLSLSFLVLRGFLPSGSQNFQVCSCLKNQHLDAPGHARLFSPFSLSAPNESARSRPRDPDWFRVGARGESREVRYNPNSRPGSRINQSATNPSPLLACRCAHEQTFTSNADYDRRLRTRAHAGLDFAVKK